MIASSDPLRMYQDYSDAKTVLVRGQVTLKLQTDEPNINMESPSSEVLQSC